MTVLVYKSARIYTKRDSNGYTAEYAWLNQASCHLHGAWAKTEQDVINKAQCVIDNVLNDRRIFRKFFSMRLR